MAIMNEGAEPEELENDDLDEGEPAEKPEPERVPDDPNEPIEVVTDEAKRESRKARRAERQNQFKAAQEEAARLRAENEQLRRQPQYQPQQQRQQENPGVARLRQIDDATDRLHREYTALHKSGQMTPELQAKFEQEARSMQTAKMAAVADLQRPQIDEQEIIRKAAWHQFTTEHADVFHDPNPNVQNWAWAEYHRRRAEGHADTKEMVEEILDQCRIKFGKTPRKLRGSRPDQATKQRFTGISSRGAGANVQEDGTIKMGPHERRMARLAFSDYKDPKTGKGLTEAQMNQRWANTVGKKLQAERKGG